MPTGGPLTPGALYHTGGVVNRPAMPWEADTLIPRGYEVLKKGEADRRDSVLARILRDERIVSPEDPRHINNIARGGMSMIMQKIQFAHTGAVMGGGRYSPLSQYARSVEQRAAPQPAAPRYNTSGSDSRGTTINNFHIQASGSLQTNSGQPNMAVIKALAEEMAAAQDREHQRRVLTMEQSRRNMRVS